VGKGGRLCNIEPGVVRPFSRVLQADPAGWRRAETGLGLGAIFGTDLPADPRFTGPVTGWLAALVADGAAATVARAARGLPPPDRSPTSK